MSRRRFVAERLNPHFGYFYTVERSLHRGKTKWQSMEIVDTKEFGRVLLLDGVTQVTQKYEFLYHEPMVHPALVAHPEPKDVLIIGAGDGGILREVLKHPVDKAVMAELDDGVVDFSKRLMPEISQGAFDDPRFRLEIGDGRKYVETTSEKYDAVIMDMTDPFGPSAMLYTREFFQKVKATFRDDRGLFVMHTESPVTRPNTFKQCLRTLGEVFKHRRTFLLYIEMYATLWSITVCSDTIDVAAIPPVEIGNRLAARGIAGLQVYTPATHHGMLAIPPYVQALIDGVPEVPPITDAEPKVIDDIDINSGGDLRISDEPAEPAMRGGKKTAARAAKKAGGAAKKAVAKKAAAKKAGRAATRPAKTAARKAGRTAKKTARRAGGRGRR